MHRALEQSKSDGDICISVCGRFVFRDLKLSLVCAMNHTVDCNGASYNLLAAHFSHLHDRIRKVCTFEEPERDCTGRLNAEDGQWMLQTSAYVELFSTPVLCR